MIAATPPEPPEFVTPAVVDTVWISELGSRGLPIDRGYVFATQPPDVRGTRADDASRRSPATLLWLWQDDAPIPQQRSVADGARDYLAALDQHGDWLGDDIAARPLWRVQLRTCHHELAEMLYPQMFDFGGVRLMLWLDPAHAEPALTTALPRVRVDAWHLDDLYVVRRQHMRVTPATDHSPIQWTFSGVLGYPRYPIGSLPACEELDRRRVVWMADDPPGPGRGPFQLAESHSAPVTQ